MSSIKLRGDFKALERFAAKIESAGRDSTMRILGEQLAEETIELIKQGFETSTDPYGKPWEKLQVREGKPLEDTGGLKTSWHTANVGPRGFTVESGKDYAVYHQKGTGIHGPSKQPIRPVRAKALRIPGVGYRKQVAGSPKRRMVPDAGRLSARWRRQLVEAATETLSELFERR